VLSNSQQKSGPIKVKQDAHNFLVEIDFRDKHRAKQIAGRQWDGRRRAWVFDISTDTYRALVDEFRGDADQFEIEAPSKDMVADAGHAHQNESEDLDLPELEESGPELALVTDRISDVADSLNAIKEGMVSQERLLGKILEQRIDAEATSQEAAETAEEAVPKTPNLLRDNHVTFIESALMQLSVFSAESRPSFISWISAHEPLRSPRKFITETHEHLAAQLRQLLGSRDTSFKNLLQDARDQDLIYWNPRDPVNVHHILNAMNINRNRIAHGINLSQDELSNRAITYLMQLALIWPYVVISTED
jgi:hypothetical protein